MIYGINFRPKADPSYTDMGFPPGFAKKFRERRRLPDPQTGKLTTALLVGICDSKQSLDEALIQANNGHRRLHVETRKTGGPTLYGIYTY